MATLEAPAPAELLSVGDAARLANVSPDTIRVWMRSGRLRAAGRTVGTRARLFTREDVEKLVEERKSW